jgi:hypothetical protein
MRELIGAAFGITVGSVYFVAQLGSSIGLFILGWSVLIEAAQGLL